MPSIPRALTPPEPSLSQQLEGFYAGRQAFQQLKAAWIQHHYAEEARDREITQRWQAEKAAEAAGLTELLNKDFSAMETVSEKVSMGFRE